MRFRLFYFNTQTGQKSSVIIDGENPEGAKARFFKSYPHCRPIKVKVVQAEATS